MLSNNDKLIERIDTYGRILWLPPLAPDVAISYRAIIERAIADCPDWDHVAEILDNRGINLKLAVNHHGPQNYMIWTLGIREGTWANARLEALEA